MKTTKIKIILLASLLALTASIGLNQNTAVLAVQDFSAATADEIIVAVTGARLRAAPSLRAKVIGAAKLGTVFRVSGRSGDWYRISLPNGRMGWISGTIVREYTEARRDLIYQELADKYLRREETDFKTAAEVYGFLTMARNRVEDRSVRAALELKRMRMLHRALEKIPIERARPWNKNETSIYQDFVSANQALIVYSEPAGQWFVNARALWSLQTEYADTPVADDIAWEAARTPLAGECEGFIGCSLPVLVSAEGEYLRLYPRGKYSRDALKLINQILNGMAGNNGYQYEAPVPEERGDFDWAIGRLREILAKTAEPGRGQALRLLAQIEKKYSK